MPKETTTKRRQPPKGVRFTKDNQPSGEKKSEGKKKRKFTRELMKEMLNMKYKFAEDSALKKQLVAAFGNDILDKPIGEVMTLMQMQKAVLKGDTAAFNSIIDQAFGRPAQAIINTDEDGNVLPPVHLTLPKGMNIDLPSNTDGADE